jgi:hypothetical protein
VDRHTRRLVNGDEVVVLEDNASCELRRQFSPGRPSGWRRATGLRLCIRVGVPVVPGGLRAPCVSRRRATQLAPREVAGQLEDIAFGNPVAWPAPRAAHPNLALAQECMKPAERHVAQNLPQHAVEATASIVFSEGNPGALGLHPAMISR